MMTPEQRLELKRIWGLVGDARNRLTELWKEVLASDENADLTGIGEIVGNLADVDIELDMFITTREEHDEQRLSIHMS